MRFVETSGADKKKSGFQPIPDRYETIEQVQSDLRKAGLESSNLILGIDFTESNTWTGKRALGSVIRIIGHTLEAFDDDNIPAFGFGDATTLAQRCFPLFQGQGCLGFDDVLTRYNEITPNVKLYGPTSFAPVIHEAIKAVKEDPGYHILVIVADGHVNEREATRQAIVEASKYPISIVMVGVGDGPWEIMEEFDDQLPARQFDNFQFVEYNKVLKRNLKNPEAGFAMQALMEIPEQYQTIRNLVCSSSTGRRGQTPLTLFT
ncbi:E3 ubiquitin-protein ligase RGLG2 [Phytophthora ramorum]|uniref:E3 ubiquitin-protein ligase RGLG2 n=1 Tax=Phytophthora ramorum TaxID=164328 RepID=UPI0030AE6EED|nr:E3 ubiquitin-protein ligase RGLG2 [Phytophthora ramorum]